MIDNTALLHDLLVEGKIALEDAPFLAEWPGSMPVGWDFGRAEGMLLGLAIGDGLGNTSESMLPGERFEQYGEIRDYLPNRHAGYRPVGVPSDDTQMTFWTLEQLIEDGGLVPDHLAERFTREEIYGIGHTVRSFLHEYKDLGVPWEQAGQASAGNGALMRIAPVLVPHLRQPSPGLWADAALAGMVTHNDRASNACCVAFVHLLWECLRLEQAPEPEWWVDTFLAAARQIEGDSSYTCNNRELPYSGPLWKFIEQEVRPAVNENWSTVKVCNTWYSGAFLLETMPCALLILARHGHDPEEAIIRAVNDTWDNDTVAAIVGAAVGALHGRAGLPERWIQGLIGRTGASNDGRVFELIEAAKRFLVDDGMG